MAIAPGSLLVERYRADSLLGRGGMGEVWRCRDLEQGQDVAIKAVKAALLREPGAARLFHNEVVAVARLDHPGIVPVYDLVRDERLGALLVMELREGVDLGAFGAARPGWPEVRSVLAQILEALAYAHARGVLHLDIKPENVVVSPGPRATLLDFGIARVRRPGRGIERWFDRDAVIGTVEYMAPEQCAGAFERFGPWSDLFSVGAVAFELCSGRRAFPGASDPAGVRLRLMDPPPRLVPGIRGVPAAFVELCASLLALEPRDRPATAADALAALRALDAPAAAGRDAGGPPSTLRSAGPSPDAATREPPPTSVRPADAATVPFAGREASLLETAALDRQGPSHASGVTVPAVAAAMAERPVPAEASAPAAGAYGLFGLRDPPVLGRADERRAVWTAVCSAAIERRTRIVLLEGPAGAGKSRLARDAMERAVELGICTAMQTWWSAEGSGDEGLRGLIENLLDTRGSPAAEVAARVDFWLERGRPPRRPPMAADRAFAREVELLLRPPRDAAPDAGLPLRVAMEAIARAAAVRPVLLWLDDVHWSRGEAAALAQALTAQAPALPVCVVATARTDEIADQAAYQAFASAPGVERVRVDKLDEGATRRLLRGLLDVDEELCAVLAGRAEGNPLFACLLLRQLVAADVVGRREGRYRLTGSFDLATVPAGVDALFRRRVEQSGADRRELAALSLVRERVSLEVAGELARARAGHDLEGAIGRALAAGLLHIEGSAYVWEHGLLREHLVKSVRAEDAPSLHAAAAAALAPLVDREDVQEERAHHLFAAGRAREACAALLEAGLWSLRRAERAARKSRFEVLAARAREALLVDLEARAHAELAYAHAEVGDTTGAAGALGAARILLERGAGEVAASWVWLRQSQVVRLEGRVADGAVATREALDRARRAGVGEVERLALLQHGVDLCRSRDTVEARRVVEEAARLCREASDRTGESMALRTLAYISEPPAALAFAERAVEQARAAGALRIELVAKQVRVDMLWQTGARDAARREAGELSAEAGRRGLRQTVSLLELQCAGWAAGASDWDDARAHRDAAARSGAASGSVAERLVLAALDVVLARAAGDFPAAEAALVPIEVGEPRLDDATFRDLLALAATLAPPALVDRLLAAAAPPRPSAG